MIDHLKLHNISEETVKKERLEYDILESDDDDDESSKDEIYEENKENNTENSETVVSSEFY